MYIGVAVDSHGHCLYAIDAPLQQRYCLQLLYFKNQDAAPVNLPCATLSATSNAAAGSASMANVKSQPSATALAESPTYNKSLLSK